MEKLSKVFREVASGKSAGANLRRRCARVTGHHGGRGVAYTTLKRWKNLGLVAFKVAIKRNGSGARNRHVVDGPILLTAAGAKRVY